MEGHRLAHVMSKIVDLIPEHIAFGWLQLEAMFSESVKNNPHPVQVFLLSVREDNDIIQINETIHEV